ncbi:MAG: MotA/TolQ/ExbB proton channel family protein [Gammaproteobacteria bacterium]
MIKPLTAHVVPPEHLLLLVWLCLTGLVVFGAVVCVDHGLLQQMLRADRSQICIVVIVMYLVGLGHTLFRTHLVSSELARAEHLLSRLEAEQGSITISPLALQFSNGAAAPRGFMTDYLIEAFGGARNSAEVVEPGDTDLLAAYTSRIRSANEFGWFYIDLMLKVGFLGTLVGFILMLSSVADTGSLDATTMQKVLKQMSLGMSTALYTTLASLVGGILLSVPYYLLDRGLERLLQLAVYAKGVIVPSRWPAT